MGRGVGVLYENGRNTDRMMRGRWEVKRLAFRMDWKAQIMRSARRSSVFKSIYTIHALGCQVRAAPRHPTTLPPSISQALHFSTANPFWFSIIKEGILTGSYKKMASTFRGEAGRAWWDGDELYPTASSRQQPHHYLKKNISHALSSRCTYKYKLLSSSVSKIYHCV